MTKQLTSNSLRVFVCASLATFALSARAVAQDTKPDASSGAAANQPAAAPAKEKSKYLRYMRAGSGGAQARNLGSADGNGIGKLAAGTLVAVYDERGDWLECEVPGGFEIWVYGQYIKASSEAGVLEITGSDVRARPLPSSGPESYPLQPNLSKGDRVRLIARNDANKPLAEDWVKVYSPPGVRGFVAKSECEALPAGVAGASLWATAIVEARKRPPVSSLSESGTATGTATPASAPNPAAAGAILTPQQAVEELKSADAAFARERAAEKPDLVPVRAMYQRVYDGANEGATRDLAKRTMAQVDTLIEFHAIKDAVRAESERAALEQAKRQEALAKAAATKDVYGDRFESRGWVEKRAVPGQAPTYILRWSGDPVAEITCNSGRYDLAMFNGYEVGVNGEVLRNYVPGDIGRVAVPRLIDAKAIEVLSGRSR